jgi:hypothetical protein
LGGEGPALRWFKLTVLCAMAVIAQVYYMCMPESTLSPHSWTMSLATEKMKHLCEHSAHARSYLQFLYNNPLVAREKSETAKQFFSPQIVNPQILGLVPLSQIRKFLMCASPQIKNSSNFYDSSTYHKYSQIST